MVPQNLSLNVVQNRCLTVSCKPNLNSSILNEHMRKTNILASLSFFRGLITVLSLNIQKNGRLINIPFPTQERQPIFELITITDTKNLKHD